MTPSKHRPDLSESLDGDSLGACLRRIYGLHLGPGESPREVLLTARDWPRTLPALREALRRIGGPAWFTISGPSGAEGLAILASYDAAKGMVRLRPSAGTEDRPPADRFDMDGKPLRAPAPPPSRDGANVGPGGRNPAW